MRLENFPDVEEALAYLRLNHYRLSFHCHPTGWLCKETAEVFLPEELTMEACQRYTQSNGQHHVTVLYAVRTPDGRKGIILDNCHTYGNPLAG